MTPDDDLAATEERLREAERDALIERVRAVMDEVASMRGTKVINAELRDHLAHVIGGWAYRLLEEDRRWRHAIE